MNVEQIEAEVKQLVESYLGVDSDALNFLKAYCRYCHKIDDTIDEKNYTSEHVLETSDLACQVFNCNFFRQYAAQLYLVDRLINIDYADSVIWEQSKIEWQRNQADVLRNAANHMTFAVILIVCGREALRDVSMKIRTHSHLRHHDEQGKPV